MNIPYAVKKIGYTVANSIGSLSSRLGHPISVVGRDNSTPQAKSVEDLVAIHFDLIGEPDHICRRTLTRALTFLEAQQTPVLVETGSSAWGTNSSVLFDSYIRSFGGSFNTVDIRMQPLFKLRKQLGTNSRVTCSDSVKFLNRFVFEDSNSKLGLIYLDSWDLDVSNPWPSALHGMRELIAAMPKIASGTLLLIDDTPRDLSYFSDSNFTVASSFYKTFDLIPGKGMLINKILSQRKDVELLQHEYQVLWRFL
jgi:hypothetical protein